MTALLLLAGVLAVFDVLAGFFLLLRLTGAIFYPKEVHRGRAFALVLLLAASIAATVPFFRWADATIDADLNRRIERCIERGGVVYGSNARHCYVPKEPR